VRRGDALGPYVVESVSAAAMAGLAEVLRDPNPIHLDPDAVRALGLGDRVINQGPANGSYVVAMLRAAFPDGRLRALELRLLGNVRAEDRVVAGGTVVAVDDDGTCCCEVWLDVDGGARAIAGTARVEPSSTG
jgi:acyl dehydratase